MHRLGEPSSSRAPVVLVDRRRAGSRSLAPTRRSSSGPRRRRGPTYPQRLARAQGLRGDQRDRRRGAGEVAGARAERRELRRCARYPRPTMNAQRCWFFELCARQSRGDDPVEVSRLERPAVELADRALRSGSRPRRSSRGAALPRGVAGSARATRKPPGSSSSVTGARDRGAARRARPRRHGPPRRGERSAQVRRRGMRAIVARYTGNSYSHECRPPSTISVSVTASGGRRGASRRAARGRATGTTPSSVPWTSRTGTRIARTAWLARHGRDGVAAGLEVDPGRQPGERPGQTAGDGQPGEPERLAGEARRVGGGGDGDHGVDLGSVRRRDQRAGGAHRVAEDRDGRDLATGPERRRRRHARPARTRRPTSAAPPARSRRGRGRRS